MVLGLPRSAHHSALLAAADIQPAHELLRAACFRTLKDAMRSEHRLQQALLSGITKLAMCPTELVGSLLIQLHEMCDCNLSALLGVAAGRPCSDRIYPQRAPDGLADSLAFLMSRRDQVSRRLLRLLTCPERE